MANKAASDNEMDLRQRIIVPGIEPAAVRIVNDDFHVREFYGF